MDTDTQSTWLWILDSWAVSIMPSRFIYIITLSKCSPLWWSVEFYSHCRKAIGLNDVFIVVLNAYDILHSNRTLKDPCGPDATKSLWEGGSESEGICDNRNRSHSGMFWRLRGIGTQECKGPLGNANLEKWVLFCHFQEECCPESIWVWGVPELQNCTVWSVCAFKQL